MSFSKSESYALIIDGISIECIFSNNKQDDFRGIAMKCVAVLCCRMSPSQKANVIFYLSINFKLCLYFLDIILLLLGGCITVPYAPLPIIILLI